MPMVPFIEAFPELGTRETRTVLVPEDELLPAGAYGFLGFYCNEPGCDCRRVTIQVLRPETGCSRVWATISYGRETPEFYTRWSRTCQDGREMAGASLDTL